MKNKWGLFIGFIPITLNNFSYQSIKNLFDPSTQVYWLTWTRHTSVLKGCLILFIESMLWIALILSLFWYYNLLLYWFLSWYIVYSLFFIYMYTRHPYNKWWVEIYNYSISLFEKVILWWVGSNVVFVHWVNEIYFSKIKNLSCSKQTIKIFIDRVSGICTENRRTLTNQEKLALLESLWKHYHDLITNPVLYEKPNTPILFPTVEFSYKNKKYDLQELMCEVLPAILDHFSLPSYKQGGKYFKKDLFKDRYQSYSWLRYMLIILNLSIIQMNKSLGQNKSFIFLMRSWPALMPLYGLEIYYGLTRVVSMKPTIKTQNDNMISIDFQHRHSNFIGGLKSLDYMFRKDSKRESDAFIWVSMCFDDIPSIKPRILWFWGWGVFFILCLLWSHYSLYSQIDHFMHSTDPIPKWHTSWCQMQKDGDLLIHLYIYSRLMLLFISIWYHSKWIGAFSWIFIMLGLLATHLTLKKFTPRLIGYWKTSLMIFFVLVIGAWFHVLWWGNPIIDELKVKSFIQTLPWKIHLFMILPKLILLLMVLCRIVFSLTWYRWPYHGIKTLSCILSWLFMYKYKHLRVINVEMKKILRILVSFLLLRQAHLQYIWRVVIPHQHSNNLSSPYQKKEFLKIVYPTHTDMFEFECYQYYGLECWLNVNKITGKNLQDKDASEFMYTVNKENNQMENFMVQALQLHQN